MINQGRGYLSEGALVRVGSGFCRLQERESLVLSSSSSSSVYWAVVRRSSLSRLNCWRRGEWRPLPPCWNTPPSRGRQESQAASQERDRGGGTKGAGTQRRLLSHQAPAAARQPAGALLRARDHHQMSAPEWGTFGMFMCPLGPCLSPCKWLAASASTASCSCSAVIFSVKLLCCTSSS